MSKIKYNRATLKEQVSNITTQYLKDIDSQSNTNIYQKIIEAVEESIFEAILSHTNGNQQAAASVSGVSRNTIRKKIEKYNIKST
jgi:Fis family transcriptional regulator, factor for inversion stimulation protein